MKIEYSVDVTLLERRLLDAVASRPSGGLETPVLLLVPTRRLADHLTRVIAAHCGAALGVHVFTHGAFARQVIRFALEVPPDILPDVALAELVEGLFEGYCGDDGEYLRAHAGARSMLCGALRDLRDAGVSPEYVADSGASKAVEWLYPRHIAALDRLAAADGLTDEAGLVREALPHIAGFLERKGIRRAYHHGAYELIGVHLDLVHAVDDAMDEAPGLVFLLPGDPETPGGACARRFVDVSRMTRPDLAHELSRLPSPPSPEEASSSRREYVERLRRVGDTGAVGEDAGPLGEPVLEIRHAQGAEEELRVAVLRALALCHRDGFALNEIAIVARSLQTYLPFLEATLDGMDIPWTTTATPPLRRVHAVGSLVRLLKVLAGDFGRRDVIDLLRSHRPRLDGIDDGLVDVDHWDRRSRRGRLVAGIEAWRALAELCRGGENSAAAETLLAVLDALEEERQAWSRACTLEDHVEFLRGLVRRRVCVREDSGEEIRVEEVIATLATVARVRKTVVGTAAVVSPADVGGLLERVVDAGSAPSLSKGSSGLRILDLMQARGIVHRAVIWIGFQHGVFPRRGRQNPYLVDRARVEIATCASRPLYPEADASAEEKLLLVMTLGAVRDRVAISYQRADEKGSKNARSSALREVARVFLGRPDSAALLDDSPENPFRPELISVDPHERAFGFAASPAIGMCPAADALVAHAATTADRFVAVREFLRRASMQIPGALRALDAVDVVDRFGLEGENPLRFDGFTGIAAPESTYSSPTAVELLACCPQAFFLRHVLRVRELDDEAMPYQVDARDMGSAVHVTMQELYGPLTNLDRPLCREDVDRFAVEAPGRLEEIWRRNLQKAAGPSGGELERLYVMLGDRWLPELRCLLERDLEKLVASKVESIACEETVQSELILPGGDVVRFRGRLDRILVSASEVVIDDFKTGKNLKKWNDPRRIVRAQKAQLPLYWAMLSAGGERQVHGRYLGVNPWAGDDLREAGLDKMKELEVGFLETLDTILSLARQGLFPVLQSEDVCRYCEFRRTCRKSHTPTRKRLEAAPGLDDFHDTQDKSLAKPTLASVRQKSETEARS